MASLNDKPAPHEGVSETVDPSITTPHSLARAVHARRSEYVRPHQIKVKIGTWNVAACPGTDKDLAAWFTGGEGIDQRFASMDLSKNSAVESDPKMRDGFLEPMHLTAGKGIGLYVLGLQEIVDLNMTKEYMNRAVYTDHSAMDKWKAALEAALPPGYELITAEQMTGLLLLVYASPEVAPTVSSVSTKQVGTGLLGYFGNKGAVATRLVLGETTRMVFVNCHLASGAGSSYLDRRCWDVAQILSKTQFDPIVLSGVEEDEEEKIGEEDLAFWFGDLNFRLDGLPGDDIRRLLTLHARGEYAISEHPKNLLGEQGVIVMKDDGEDDTTTALSLHTREESFDSAGDLPDPDDFPEDPSQDPTSLQATIDSLLPHDQLQRVIKERKAFHDGWREGPVTFLPTYKYDVGTVGLFDSSEKQRAPSWCDRILFRTRKDKLAYQAKIKEEQEAKKKDDEMKSRGLEDTDDDVLFSYDPDADGEDVTTTMESAAYSEYDETEEFDGEDLVTKEGFHDRIKIEIYASHQRITSSDHKPITSIVTLDYDAVVPDLKATIHTEVARQLDRAENEGRPGITVIVEGDSSNEENIVDYGEIGPLEKKQRSATIANTGGVAAKFSFVEKPSVEDGDDSFPQWLKMTFVRADEDSTEPLGESVTLDPGETVVVLLEIQISSLSHIRALNEARVRIDDVLVLRVEDGRDHFIPVRGTWQPTCLGRSISELIRVPDGGIRKFIHDEGIKGAIPYDLDMHCSAPKEIFKLTEAVSTLVERCLAEEMMLEEAILPRDPGWPLDSTTWRVGKSEMQESRIALVKALDTDTSLLEALPLELPASFKLEIVCSILLVFLESLTDGLIPTHLWAKLSTALPNVTSLPASAWPDTKTHVLDILSSAPNHNIAFVFLTATLSRASSELTPVTSDAKTAGLTRRLSFRRAGAEDEDAKKKKIRDRRYAEIVAPLVCRVSDKEKGARERTRAVVEMFLRRDDES